VIDVELQTQAHILGQYIASLAHNRAHRQPDTVVHVPDVFQLLGLLVARMRALPIVRRHSKHANELIENFTRFTLPRQNKQQDGNAQIGGQHVNPNVNAEGRQKGKQIGRLLHRFQEHYADA
jgi:hypothetical protein